MPNFSFYAGKLLVFLLRRLAAADVALLLVDVEDHPHLAVKRRFDLPQALADVFMYGRRKLERCCRAPNPRKAAGKCPRCRPYRPRFSGLSSLAER